MFAFKLPFMRLEVKLEKRKLKMHNANKHKTAQENFFDLEK